MPKSSPDVIEESIKTADETGKSITDFWNWVASPKMGAKAKDKLVQKAKGGRVNYAEGSGDPLVDLKKWWNEQAWNNEG